MRVDSDTVRGPILKDMTFTPAATTLDCSDVAAVSAFWSATLARPLDPGATSYFARISADGPGAGTWMFIGVPEPKTAKNRLHIDFVSDDRIAEVERLLGLGATRVSDHDEFGHRWSTLRDVKGNEFCVADAPA
ncbi:VOC family protein [Nostocoides vanveenii]|uniref:VOC family protein n=2 Tax=Nostocoides vanveenii TaxID=330835 RepID=A0ABP4X7A1_9MICO